MERKTARVRSEAILTLNVSGINLAGVAVVREVAVLQLSLLRLQLSSPVLTT